VGKAGHDCLSYAIFKRMAGDNTMPQFWVMGERLIAHSSWWIQALCLFAYAKEIAIDKRTRLITIRTKWLWGLFRPVRRIHYKRVGLIHFGADSVPIGWRIEDAIKREWFNIWFLMYPRGEALKLWTFIGVTDGIHEPKHRVKALEYLRLLQEFTGKRIG
jgi:hypothetical protein